MSLSSLNVHHHLSVTAFSRSYASELSENGHTFTQTEHP